jgi:predicted metal-dependent phosphotriesterase family hydrolase
VSADAVTIRSVRGEVAVAADAFVDAHEHTWIDAPAAARAAGLPALTNAEAVADELREFAGAGGGAVLDCQPPFCGRDARRMEAIAARSGVAVVACTGFHLPAWYDAGSPPWSWQPSRAADEFARELTIGLRELPEARAGAIKAAHDGDTADPRVRALLEAAAEAALRTDAPLVVHTERGAQVEELAALLAGAGVEPSRVLLCHVDKRPDAALHAELADAGFRLEYDTFVRPRYAPDTGVWPLVERMLDDGYAASIAVGLDLADPALWAFAGGPGMSALTRDVPARLSALGASAGDVRALCGGTALGLLGLPVEARR